MASNVFPIRPEDFGFFIKNQKIKSLLQSLRQKYFQLHNRIDLGIKTPLSYCLVPDIRPMILLRWGVTNFLLLAIFELYFHGNLNLIPFVFLVAMNVLSQCFIAFLHYGITNKKSYVLELFYVNGFLDISLLFLVGVIVGLNNPVILVIIFSYNVIIAIVISNLMFLSSVSFTLVLVCLYIIFADSFVINGLLQEAMYYLNLSPVFFFGTTFLIVISIVLSNILGRNYRRIYFEIFKQNKILFDLNLNAKKVLEIASNVSHALTTNQFFDVINDLFAKMVRPKSFENRKGEIRLKDQNQKYLCLEIDDAKPFASIFNTDYKDILVSMLEDKLKICRTYDQLMDHAEIVHGEQLKTIGFLSAGMAHEINNPLNFMALRCNIIENDVRSLDGFKKEPDKFEKLHKSVEVIRKGCVRIEKIISSIRMLGRPLNHNVQNSSLEEQLDAALTLIEHESNKYDIKIENNVNDQIKGEIPDIILGQVFLNIILNSVQAIGDMPNGKISVNASEGHDFINVEIFDNGPGIDEATKDKMFEPFFTTKMDKGGTGLGLTIVQKLLFDYGGKMEIHSTFGEGTSVSLYIPKGKKIVVGVRS